MTKEMNPDEITDVEEGGGKFAEPHTSPTAQNGNQGTTAESMHVVVRETMTMTAAPSSSAEVVGRGGEPLWFTIVNICLTGLFIICAIVQYNDPDPVGWIILYTLAALLALLYQFRRWSYPEVTALYALATLGVAIYLTHKVISRGEFIFGEVGLEMLGTYLVCIWMLVLTYRGFVRGDGHERIRNVVYFGGTTASSSSPVV